MNNNFNNIFNIYVWYNKRVLIIIRVCLVCVFFYQDFQSASLTDGAARTLKETIPLFLNGLTLLAATAPALASLMDKENESVINFDRCCHLIYEDADYLLKEHKDSMKKIIQMYRRSLKRVEKSDHLVQRQVNVDLLATVNTSPSGIIDATFN